MKLFKEFKEFAVKGNVIDLAVGVIIGGAFGKIVTSLVNDVIMPLLSFVTKSGALSFETCLLLLTATNTRHWPLHRRQEHPPSTTGCS